MNLYRSFGNLMEAWVTESSQCEDSEWLENNDEDSSTPCSDMGTNLRSESVDSGVETASSDMSCPLPSCSVSTDNAEIDTFTAEREGGGLSPLSTSQSPVCSTPPPSSSSYSSPQLSPRAAQKSSTALHQKLEQALQRSDSKLKDKPQPLSVDEVLRRRPRASFVPKRHSSELVRGQRSESFGLVNSLGPSKQVCRRPMSVSCEKQDLSKRGEKGLSPGLCYLEEVCQMLEEIAKKQMRNQAFQVEMNALQEQQDTESDFKAAEEVLSSCPKLEEAEIRQYSSSEPQRRKEYPQRHFRQRSASDTTIAALHLVKFKTDCRGQHQSTNDLLEEDDAVQESKKEETKKTARNWKLKIGSIGRNDSALKEIKSQQTQSSEKNPARRRLSQLFSRSRRKTLTV